VHQVGFTKEITIVTVCEHNKVLRRKYNRMKTTRLKVAQNTEATTLIELPQHTEENKYVIKQRVSQ